MARVDPAWIEPAAEHLVARTYSEPHWSARRGAVMAYERVSLFGIPIVTQRRVTYSTIDPELSRELFIRHALVQGEWTSQHRFVRDNARRVAEIERLEARARRRDLLVDEESLFDFFDQRVPRTVVSQRHFDRWWRKAHKDAPDLLTYDDSVLRRTDAAAVSEEAFPSVWYAGEIPLSLTYQFEPGAEADGVTVHVPVDVLGQLDPAPFSWQVPGLREELVTALIRSLPKAIRRSYVPAPNFATAALGSLAGRSGRGDLREELARTLEDMGGSRIEPSDWDDARLPAHLRMTFAVHDGAGADSPVRATGADLAELARRLAPRTAQALGDAAAQAGPDLRRQGLTTWVEGDPPDLPDVVEVSRAGSVVRGYPALVDDGDSVSVQVLGSADEAARRHRAGLRRLLVLELPSPASAALRRLTNRQRLSLGTAPHAGGSAALLADCVDAAVDQLLDGDRADVRSAAAYAARRDRVRPQLPRAFESLLGPVVAILDLAQDIRQQTEAMTSPLLAPAVADVRAQVTALLPDRFVTRTGASRLGDLQRYLEAVRVRLRRLPDNVRRDAAAMARLRTVTDEVAAAVAALPEGRRSTPEVDDLHWMLEELRVSLFAQGVRTAYPVSEQRIYRALDALTVP